MQSMDRMQVRRLLEAGDKTQDLIRHLCVESTEAGSGAYWLALAKANAATLTALECLLDRPGERRRGLDPDVPPAEVSEALAALLDAAETLARQWPHLLADHAPIEVPSSAYDRRRSTRRSLQTRPTVVTAEDPWREDWRRRR